MTEPNKIYQQFLTHFPFETTPGQEGFFRMLSSALARTNHFEVLMMKGYAGTGKTTALATVVQTLPQFRWKTVLLAPTGRAAKILGQYANKRGMTIHKKIYQRVFDPSGFSFFTLTDNLHTNTLFIVDEASMIGERSGLRAGMFGQRDLLEDVMLYVNNDKNCKLLLVGDDAQLPPVGADESPALDREHLQAKFYTALEQMALEDVVRQAQESGILNNATQLRRVIKAELDGEFKFNLEPFTDVCAIGGMDLQEELEWAYHQYGAEGTMVVCRSNKRANLFNQQIRSRILWQETELEAGDLLMAVKNNYFWLDEKSPVGFIANGDTVEVQKVERYQEFYGFRFADVIVKLVDYPEQEEFSCKILMDTLHVEGPSLKGEQIKALFEAIALDHQDIKDKRKRNQKVFRDPFFNALQVKFAYAVTCHKAQGGQWPVVFIDHGYLPDEQMEITFWRWLYTAVTRATERLYLVNFDPKFLPPSGD